MTRRPRLSVALAALVASAASLGVAVVHVGAQSAVERLAAGFSARPRAEAAGERLEFRHLTREHGLPNTAVTAARQDALGFVWVGTSDGLVRYDGAEMRPFRYQSADTTTVPGNVTTAISAVPRRRGAPGGALYVGTTEGLARYDPAREAFTRIGGVGDVRAVAVDSSGGAWVALGSGALAYVAPAARSARRVPLGASRLGDVTAVMVGADDAVWAGTESGVVRLAPRSRQVRAFRPDSAALASPTVRFAPVSSLAPRAAGGVYVGTLGTGLWLLTPKDGRYMRVPLGDDPGALMVSSVHEDATGAVWVGLLGGGGLRRVGTGAAPAVYKNRPDDPASLADDDVSALFEDRQGLLWVATYNGLDRVDLARGMALRLRADAGDPQSLASNTVLSVLPTDSALYVGTDRSLDVSTDGQHFRHEVFGVDGGQTEHPVTALAQARDGAVWAGTAGGGLYLLTAEGPERAPLRSSIGNGQAWPAVGALLVGADDEVWVGTGADGLVRYDPDSQQAVTYRRDQARVSSIASNDVLALSRTSDGALWAGTTAGLCRLTDSRSPGRFTCFRADAADPRALANGVVQALLATPDALWVGTRGGLHRLDPRRPESGFTRYTAATSDLPGDMVHGIAEGELGLLWLSTSGGLVRFDPGTEVFTQRLGRVGAATNYGRALAWRDSLLYAGGTAGLLRVNPSTLDAANPNPPQVVFTGVDVGGRAVVPGTEAPLAVAAPVADALRLDPNQNDVTFRFAGLHFSDPGAMTYRFRLDGDDEGWREGGTRREADYTNLNPGEYTFEVVARTVDGVDSAPTTLAVFVDKPWYQKWWAYLAYAVLGLLAVAHWGRWQQGRALRREREGALRRETELRAETAEAERRKAQAEQREADAERREAVAEAERQRAEAVALKAENDRAAAELERTRSVEEANAKLEAANGRLETSLRDLQATQAQLVQSEKLASLGQLTAGIAHEIKNPLNFVNNFADLSVELVGDIEADLRADPLRPAGEALANVEDLLSDLRENSRRIREHGQRADRIVRAMLLHSRGGASERARVDANRYVDEYANLAFHGARANNPDFNVTLVRELAPDAGEVEVVPQEFGRVLINLLTNAFHAVHARRQATPAGYQPTVTLRTQRDDGTLVIEVADNGTGIPETVQQRIFEPFFTTKPTGEGTGLGLSLVHDIVTQVHGGEIDVESAEGEGTVFTVRLPAAADGRPQ